MSSHFESLLNQIICGNAQEILKQLPEESIDCVVTSPPYWALRDYGVNGQLGLEADFAEYVDTLCSVFDEIKRVLKATGTCFVNLGDTYSTRGSKGEWGQHLNSRRAHGANFTSSPLRPSTSIPDESLLQIPARFAIAMIDRGWILRNEIVWWKPNAMPSSARDRFTVDFEKVFFFVKSKKYWFDLDSVREPHRTEEMAATVKQAQKLGYEGKGSYKKWYLNQRQKAGWIIGNRGLRKGRLAARGMQRERLLHPLGKAKRCVWSIPTEPFPGEHFATYPPQLVVTPIKAGCPKRGVVLDPFVGSGTTALVARALGRNYIGIDLNPSYVRMAQTRLAKQLF